MKRLLALALILAACPAFADVIEGRVIEVPDGGTLTILARQGASIHRVRLAGIEAPAKERQFGGSSRESLRRLAAGKTVRVETTSIDAKGLLVGKVLIMRTEKDCGNQPCAPLLDPGLSQLSFGLAVIDKSNLGRQSTEAQKTYLSAEATARTKKVGLWRTAPLPARADLRPK